MSVAREFIAKVLTMPLPNGCRLMDVHREVCDHGWRWSVHVSIHRVWNADLTVRECELEEMSDRRREYVLGSFAATIEDKARMFESKNALPL